MCLVRTDIAFADDGIVSRCLLDSYEAIIEEYIIIRESRAVIHCTDVGDALARWAIYGIERLLHR